jgi:hypothetical protein
MLLCSSELKEIKKNTQECQAANLSDSETRSYVCFRTLASSGERRENDGNMGTENSSKNIWKRKMRCG